MRKRVRSRATVLWCVAIVLLAALPALLLPAGAGWITDNGNKYIIMRSLAEHGSTAIAAPAAELDPEGKFFPDGGFHFRRFDGTMRSIYPEYFPALSLPFYRLFGERGVDNEKSFVRTNSFLHQKYTSLWSFSVTEVTRSRLLIAIQTNIDYIGCGTACQGFYKKYFIYLTEMEFYISIRRRSVPQIFLIACFFGRRVIELNRNDSASGEEDVCNGVGQCQNQSVS